MSVMENQEEFGQQVSRDELLNTVSMFEQILQVMPTDPIALRALYKAHRQLDHTEKAFEYLMRWVEEAIEGQDAENAGFLLEQLKEGFPDRITEELQPRLEELQRLAGLVGGDEASETERSGSSDLDHELALAWRLYQDGKLTQEDYSNVLHDLTEMSSREVDTPVTVLYVLHDRTHKQLTRIVNYLCETSGKACIALANFVMDDELSGALPREFLLHRGAVPFARLEETWLLGVLNPFNEDLVADAERLLKAPCRTYVVAPQDYDLFLARFNTPSA